MLFFRDIGFRWKLTIPIGIIILFVLILAGRSLYSENQQAEAISIVTTRELPSLNLVQQADRDFHQAWVAERSLLMLKVGSSNYQAMQKMHQENILQVEQRIKKLDNYNPPDKVKELLAQFWQVYPKWRQMTERIEQERSTDTRAGRSVAVALSYKEGEELFNQSRDYLDQIAALIYEEANSRAKLLEAMHVSFRIGQLTLATIALVLCLWLLVFFPSLITRDLGNIINQIKTLAKGGGDLTQQMAIARRDELGQLGRYLDQFINQLRELVKQVVEHTRDSGDEVQNIGQLSRQASTSQKTQTEMMNQVAQASREMNHSIQSISDRTSEAAELTQQAHHDAMRGQSQVEVTGDSIKVLNESVNNATAAISRIEEVTVKIGSVLTVISGIAEQTNLLALNAAIEAARAGESGRGFAVVADEVRALASKTQHSTDDVKEMISNLDDSVKAAVATMQQAAEQSLQTRDSSEETKHAINAMMVAMVGVKEIAGQIASVTDEQSHSATQMQHYITDMEALAQDSLNQSSNVEQACSKLVAMYHQLNALTGKFKV
ncbi:methyl-accepting chemotaxis protein [Celerinatantimonas yamalensis]|uniref:Methyl-accepting chemotaxis protein n=1 Tax=Celerinatantimonas yamalensis TaxID=559956 RepID=A0ABW9G394_9GAMM